MSVVEQWQLKAGAVKLVPARSLLPKEAPHPQLKVHAIAALQENSATDQISVILLTAKVQASDRRRYEELGVKGTIARR